MDAATDSGQPVKHFRAVEVQSTGIDRHNIIITHPLNSIRPGSAGGKSLQHRTRVQTSIACSER